MKNAKVRALVALSSAEQLVHTTMNQLDAAHNILQGDRLDAAEPRLKALREKLKAAKLLVASTHQELSLVLLPLTKESFNGVDKKDDL